MKLYDNDAYRDGFMEAVYNLLSGDSSNDRANQVIDLFDAAPAVETEPAPLNDPLTLEELREMDGEPVWIKSNNWHNKDKWGLVSVWTGPTGDKFAVYVYSTKTGATLYPSQEYGHCWLAYRRKPEV